MKSMDDLRSQMKLNATKKKRQKKEFDEQAQDKATTIKQGGDLKNNPNDSFKTNIKAGEASKPDKPKVDRKGFTVVKADLVKALADNHMHESAILLKNWDEKDANAIAMEEHLSKGTEVGNPDDAPDPSNNMAMRGLAQSEDGKCKGCGMPPKTCKCDIEKEDLAKPGNVSEGQTHDKPIRGPGDPVSLGGMWDNLTGG